MIVGASPSIRCSIEIEGFNVPQVPVSTVQFNINKTSIVVDLVHYCLVLRISFESKLLSLVLLKRELKLNFDFKFDLGAAYGAPLFLAPKKIL